jgi:hypothetical protein
MSLKKCFGLVTMAIVGGAFAVGCSSSDTAGGTTGDSGTTVADTGVRRDTGTTTEDAGDTADAAGTCTPQPVTGYTPSTYNPPKQQNVCTTAEINKIATDCSADFTSAACVADLSGTGVSAACRTCAITPEAAANWGPFVQLAGDAGAADISFNNAGCIDLVTGVAGCGQAYYGVVDCIQASCPVGTNGEACGTDPNVDPAKTCTSATLKTFCKPYLVSQACGTGIQKPEVGSTCFGTPLAVVTGVLTVNCGTTPGAASDAGPG